MSKGVLIGSALLAIIVVAGVALAANSFERREHSRLDDRLFAENSREHRGEHRDERRGERHHERGERHGDRDRGRRGDRQQGQPADSSAPLPDSGLFNNGKRPQVEVR